MTRPRKPDDEGVLPPDPPPASDPEPTPRFPKPVQRDASHETLADNTKVTPLDEDKHIEHGIELNET